MRLSQKQVQTVIEQVALLLASFVWTTVVLSIIAFFWIYQDVNARWDYIAKIPPEALAQAAVSPTASPSPTPTPWAGPGPTLTPTATKPPTPVATLVVEPPGILPETLNIGEPTPIPVIVHTQDEAAEFGLAAQPPEVDEPSPSTAPSNPTPQQPTQDIAPAPAPKQAELTNGVVIPNRIVIESVDIDSTVIPVGWQVVEQNGQPYSIWEVANFAIGWHNTSARLGQPGNTVMAGHHNVNGEVFRDLVNVEVGDRVTAYASGQKFEYIVELKTIIKEKGEPLEVRQRNAQWIAPTDDERLTFVTCWPYTNNTHRVIVVAKPI